MVLKFNDDFTNSRVSDLYIKEEERIIKQNSTQLGMKYINLVGYPVNPDALIKIDRKIAEEANLVVFDINRNVLSVAVINPNNKNTKELLDKLSKNNKLDIYICSSNSLKYGWKRYDDIIVTSASKKGLMEIDSKQLKEFSELIKSTDDLQTLLDKSSKSTNIKRVSETMQLILAGGLSLGASDIHIEPESDSIRIRYRLDGVLHDVAQLRSGIYKRLMSRFKLLSGMVLNSRQEAQDGRFTFDVEEKVVEVRVSIIPGSLGESIVMRLLDPTVASFDINKINLNPHIRKYIDIQLKKPNGLIITTGPTGSGKTTALYSFLKEVHNEGIKIITIENPVEYKLKGIVQTQTGDDYTFSSGLRAILRQDPDVIMVGEIRDREVAETAIHAAQTGHLVFSTLHTNSAAAGFPRLIDLGVDPFVMNTSINILIGQRLIRLLCKHCKKTYTATKEELAIIDIIMKKHPYPTEIKKDQVLYKPNGCEKCGHTGFSGRMGIYEAVVMDEKVSDVILHDPRESSIIEAGRPQKIPTLSEDGIDKVIAGITSIKELERVVELPRLDITS